MSKNILELNDATRTLYYYVDSGLCGLETGRTSCDGSHSGSCGVGKDYGIMKWFAETTEWADAATPNGIYLLDDSKSKMYAFRPFGTGKIKVFKNPIRIETRGRKFVLNPVQFKTQVSEEVPEGRVFTVKGSKGDEYRVSELNGNLSCTCSGFKFRGDCKHVKNISVAV